MYYTYEEANGYICKSIRICALQNSRELREIQLKKLWKQVFLKNPYAAMTTEAYMFSYCCPVQSCARVLHSQLPLNTDPANRAVTPCRDGLRLTAVQHVLLTAQTHRGCKGQHKNINCLQKKESYK